jgi:hypothetical protein
MLGAAGALGAEALGFGNWIDAATASPLSYFGKPVRGRAAAARTACRSLRARVRRPRCRSPCARAGPNLALCSSNVVWKS